jgi:hypothetical protein
MEIGYDVTEEDHVKFVHHYSATAPWAKRRYWFSFVVDALVFVAVGTALAIQLGTLRPLVVFGVLTILWVVMFPKYWNWDIRRRVKAARREANRSFETEVCHLRVDQNGAHVKSDIGASSFNWRAIEKIEETGSYLYIYVGPMNALMIPRRAFDSAASFDSFAAETRRLREQAAGLDQKD